MSANTGLTRRVSLSEGLVIVGVALFSALGFRAVCGARKMRDSIDAMVDERLTALDAVARS